jgi:alcohol dehydrogenase
MRAVVYDAFGAEPVLRDVPDPTPPAGGAVIRVVATGLCRSDWHGWRGHDPDVRPPHVPGHEFAGTVAAVGAGVIRWSGGERVTAPFVCACGTCASCQAGDQQVCERQTQPGFTHDGSFAEYVVVNNADVNLVRLPDGLSFAAAAALGCRFATAFRAVVAQGRVTAGEWVAVYGCGGVGLSAIMFAVAAGARVVAVDISPAALSLARTVGASLTVDSGPDVAERVREATGGGAHLSLDALGSSGTCVQSIESLRRRGRHVQVGLLPPVAGRPAVPMERVIAYELEIIGSHGLAAHRYPGMLEMITAGTVGPERLVTRTLDLAEAPAALAAMDGPTPAGVTLVRP